jgi:hypothetical protein
LEIGPRAKLFACTGQHQNPNSLISFQLVERINQIGGHFRDHTIATLRPVERDERNTVGRT